MAESYDLDLDLLQPQTKIVRLGGIDREVFPPRVKDLANLARAVSGMEGKEAGDVVDNLDQLIKILSKFMPSLASDDVDLTIGQIRGLIAFLNTMVAPDENSAMKQLGVEAVPTDEKKSPSD